MTSSAEILEGCYKDISEKTAIDAPHIFNEIDDILSDIRDHIRGIDERIFAKRNNLLIAIRLVEAFRIFNWIKICLAYGSYHSVFRELRFMLDGIAQACYIDLNHIDASLTCKLEVYKALGDMKNFIGSSLFEKIKGLRKRQNLIDVYKELSNFVHPSVEESRRWIEAPVSQDVVDSLKYNRYDKELLNLALTKSRQVGALLIHLDSHFLENFSSAD